jgi:hypothetical protein
LKSLLKFLAESPKSFLSTVHGNLNSASGLTKNSEIAKNISEWYIDPNNLLQLLRSLSPRELEICAWIYSSGGRGLRNRELTTAIETEEREIISLITDKLRQLLLIMSVQNSNDTIFYGFTEYYTAIIGQYIRLFSQCNLNNEDWQSYHGFFRFHLIAFASEITRTKPRTNQSGELHRRFQSQFVDRLNFTKAISPEIAEHETNLLYQCLIRQKWLGHTESGALIVSASFYDFLKKDITEQWNILFKWWLRFRMNGSLSFLIEKLGLISDQPLLLSELTSLWWCYDGRLKKTITSGMHTLSWENIPEILKDLWLLGILSFSVKNGCLHLCSLSDFGREFIRSQSIHLNNVPSPIITPDFEAIVSYNSPGLFLYATELCSTPANDDPMVRYRFSKERYINGLDLCKPLGIQKEFEEWLKPTGTVKDTFHNWSQAFSSSEINHIQVLKITDYKRREQLEHLPIFMELTSETIPNYGFIIKPGKEIKIRELLSNFELFPSNSQELPADSSLKFTPPAFERQPWPEEDGAIQYFTGFQNREVTDEFRLRFSNEFRSLEFHQILKIVRYAIFTANPIEIRIENNQIIKFSPKAITESGEAFFTVGTTDSEANISINLSNVKEIKIS